MRNRKYTIGLAIAFVTLVVLISLAFLTKTFLTPSGLRPTVASPRENSTRPDDESIVAAMKRLDEFDSDLIDLRRLMAAEYSTTKAVGVFTDFATNRLMVDGRFSNQLAPGLTYGSCVVSIPDSHVSGELERPGRNWFFFKEDEDPDKHLVLQDFYSVSRKEFINSFSRSDSNSILLFVHGFNVSFDEAALRASQLSYDLKFPGQTVFFSWASDGEATGYVNDATKIGDSVKDIASLIDDLAAIDDVSAIYMIGHSMGSRGLTRALVSLKDRIQTENRKKLKELILVEPDISQQIFDSRIAPGLIELGARVSLYSSNNDKAQIPRHCWFRAPRHYSAAHW